MFMYHIQENSYKICIIAQASEVPLRKNADKHMYSWSVICWVCKSLCGKPLYGDVWGYLCKLQTSAMWLLVLNAPNSLTLQQG